MSDAIYKAYNSIKELPSEVRSSFDETDQKKWMDAYNKASQNEEPEQAKVDAWMSMVDAPSSLAVETWGSVEVRDADGELVPVDTIANYADKFIENGGLMHDSHSNVPVGTVWNWDVRKHPKTGQDGIVFYFNIYRDGEVFERARDDILSGRKQAVSIGAEAPRGGYKCDDRGCYVERDVTDLYELSICETPANPEAYFINVGKDIAKAKQPLAGEKIRFNVKDVVVHQDYTTCPLQKCKKVLRDKGYKNIHISDDGKVLAKSINNEYRLFKAISKLGYPFRYDLKKQQFEIIPDYGVEQAIEEALSNGWAHEDNIGHVTLTRDIPKEVFLDWFDRGFIVKIGDNYCLKADDVAKDAGAMGVGDAGATNAVYGSKPTSLVTPTGDKKYGKRRKAKKEMTDDGNIHAVGSKKVGKSVSSIQKRCPNGYHKDDNGNCVDANGNYYQGKQEQPKQDIPKNKKPKYDDEIMEKYHKEYHNLEMVQQHDRYEIQVKAENCDKRLKEDYPKQYKELCEKFEQYRLKDFHQRYAFYKLINGGEKYKEANGSNLKNIIQNYDDIKKLIDSMKEEYKNTSLSDVIESFEKFITRYKKTYDERYTKLPKKMKELKQEQSKKMKDFKDKYGISDEEYKDWYWNHRKD